MVKKIRVALILVGFILLCVLLFFMSAFSGGIKGLWYDITKPTLDPYNIRLTEKRNSIKNRIIADFDFIDQFPNINKYGVHNTDICMRRNYDWKQPISIFDHLYKCKLISQRYYGFDADYEKTVRDLIENLTLNKEGLSFQPNQTEQLFVQKDWIRDASTTNKIIAAHNLRNEDKPASNIYEVISFIEGQNEHTVNTYSPSSDGYVVRLDLFDHGTFPSAIESSSLYEESDSDDLREDYLTTIKEKHKYGIVVVVSYTYFQK